MRALSPEPDCITHFGEHVSQSARPESSSCIRSSDSETDHAPSLLVRSSSSSRRRRLRPDPTLAVANVRDRLRYLRSNHPVILDPSDLPLVSPLGPRIAPIPPCGQRTDPVYAGRSTFCCIMLAGPSRSCILSCSSSSRPRCLGAHSERRSLSSRLTRSTIDQVSGGSRGED